MSKRHLDDLENALERSRWRVLRRYLGESYQDQAYWIIGRPDRSNQHRLDFLGLPELEEQTINDSIGCSIQNMPNRSLYFARGRSWEKELNRFLGLLQDDAQSAQKEKKRK